MVSRHTLGAAGMPRPQRLTEARTSRVLLVDGIHDLGGMQGFGEVGYSPAEPAFRHRWEAVARALLVVVAGTVKASGGEFRHSIERMEPGHYLTSSYYEHWLTAAKSADRSTAEIGPNAVAGSASSLAVRSAKFTSPANASVRLPAARTARPCFPAGLA